MWNIGNTSTGNGNAISINGYPIIASSLVENDVLKFDTASNPGGAWIPELISGGSQNIYNIDGTLTANRTVTMAGKTLTFGTPGETATITAYGPISCVSNITTEQTLQTNTIAPYNAIQVTVNNQLAAVGQNPGGQTYLVAAANNSTGSIAGVVIGDEVTATGYAFEWEYGSPDLDLIQVGSSINGDFNVTLGTGSMNVNSDAFFGSTISDGGGHKGTSGQVLSSTGTGVSWITPSASGTTIYNGNGTLSGNRVVNFGGNSLTLANTGETADLILNSPVALNNKLLDSDGYPGALGYYLQSNGLITNWQNLNTIPAYIINDSPTTSDNIWSALHTQNQINSAVTTGVNNAFQLLSSSAYDATNAVTFTGSSFCIEFLDVNAEDSTTDTCIIELYCYSYDSTYYACTYQVSVSANQTSGSWWLLNPISSSFTIPTSSTPYFSIEINVANNITKFRARSNNISGGPVPPMSYRCICRSDNSLMIPTSMDHSSDPIPTTIFDIQNRSVDLANLQDVSLTSPSSSQVLTYNGSKWTNQSIPATATTIYSGNGSLVGNRSINQAGYNLTFTGGGNFQINNSSITSYYNGSELNSFVCADGSGNLASYALTQTYYSMRIAVPINNMTSTNTAINFFALNMSNNACFDLDIYFNNQGSNDAGSVYWRVNNYISNISTGWATIPPKNGIFIPSSNSYILQGRIGNTNANILELRIVNSSFVSAPSSSGNITVIGRCPLSGATYSLPSTVPYNPSPINYWLTLQNCGPKIYNFAGQDITSAGSMSFNWLPGQQLILSFTINYNYTGSGTISFNFYVNGNIITINPTGTSVAFSQTLVNSVMSQSACFTSNQIDLVPMYLLQNGHISNGSNTLTASILTSGTLSISTSASFYSVSLQTTF